MVIFDSNEYWQCTTWDRYLELEKVPPAVKAEFLGQEKLTVSALLHLLNGRVGFRVMDLACGTGRIADSVLHAVPRNAEASMTLVDFNSRTLATARRNLKDHPSVSFLKANAYEIANAFDRSFDAVICLELLHHVSNLNLLLAQIAKVLKPGGILIGNVFAAESYAKWDKLKYGALKSLQRRLLCSLSEAVYSRSPDAAQRMIRRAGLARMRPLAREELVANLKPHFDSFDVIPGYYYWFSAKTRACPAREGPCTQNA